jgi:phosphoglycerol transferase MdoB-like AlkP superfamily enzyme
MDPNCPRLFIGLFRMISSITRLISPAVVLPIVRQQITNTKLALGQLPLLKLSLLLILFYLPFPIAKLALYLVYPEDFQSLTHDQLIHALTAGIRFDLSVIASILVFPACMLTLPIRLNAYLKWRQFWSWVACLGLLIIVFTLIVDTIYFGEVHRHINTEINAIGNDLWPLVHLAFSQYGALLAGFGFFCGAVVILWRRVFLPKAADLSLTYCSGAVCLSILLGLILVSRGGMTGKPINASDAFLVGSATEGYFALNGAFAFIHALSEDDVPNYDFMPEAAAIEITQNHIASSFSTFPQNEFPLYRYHQASTPSSTKPNVVILVLESWGAEHLDVVRTQMNLPALGVTPNFDALAKTGRLYTRFYANGQRSIQAAESILAGLPTLPGMHFLGEGVEQNRQSYIGDLAKAQGYSTFFLQSDYRASFRFNVISTIAGFDSYKGAEDIPERHRVAKPAGNWGTWDHNTLQEANLLFAKARKPFLGYIFTSTTHGPFLIPEERWRKFPDTTLLNKMLNSLYYADWALGEFIAAAKRDGYYDNTIFIVTGDHASGVQKKTKAAPNNFHVPLLVVGPGIKPEMDTRIGSHVDIMPTIIDVANWDAHFAGIGRSLFDDEKNDQRNALSVHGDMVDVISAQGWITHNFRRQIGKSPNLTPQQAKEMERSLFAQSQIVTKLMRSNKLRPASSNHE